MVVEGNGNYSVGMEEPLGYDIGLHQHLKKMKQSVIHIKLHFKIMI